MKRIHGSRGRFRDGMESRLAAPGGCGTASAPAWRHGQARCVRGSAAYIRPHKHKCAAGRRPPSPPPRRALAAHATLQVVYTAEGCVRAARSAQPCKDQKHVGSVDRGGGIQGGVQGSTVSRGWQCGGRGRCVSQQQVRRAGVPRTRAAQRLPSRVTSGVGHHGCAPQAWERLAQVRKRRRRVAPRVRLAGKVPSAVVGGGTGGAKGSAVGRRRWSRGRAGVGGRRGVSGRLQLVRVHQ